MNIKYCILLLTILLTENSAIPQVGPGLNNFRKRREIRTELESTTISPCLKPCLNGGVCLPSGICGCPDGFSGTYCEEVGNTCQESPIRPLNAMMFTNGSHGEVMCLQGYEIQEGKKSYGLECVNDIWLYEGYPSSAVPQCLPTCSPKCQNGGTCVNPNKCQCPPNFTGTFCEEKFCAEEKPALNDVMDNMNEDKLCPKGYTLDKKQTKVEIICQDHDWVIEYSQVHCEPVCDPPCGNAGKCFAPDMCFCPKSYFGDRCENRRCFDPPKNMPHSDLVKVSSKSTWLKQCHDGYLLASGNDSIDVSCKNGAWHYGVPFSDVFVPECHPICHIPCANGGICIAPDTCKCSEGFTGKYCNKRYTLTINGEKCKFPFVYRGQLYLGCTVVDRVYPWCATKTDANGRVLHSEMCYADLGWSKILETSNETPCQIPAPGWGSTTHYSCVTSSSDNVTVSICPNSALQGVTNVTRNVSYCLDEFESRSLEQVILTKGGEKCKGFYQNDGTESFYDTCTNVSGIMSETTSCGIPNAMENCLFSYGWWSSETTLSGKDCVLPFVVDGQLLYGCATTQNGTWCATQTSLEGLPITTDWCLPHNGKWQPTSDISLTHSFPFKDSSERSAMSVPIKSTADHRRCVFPFRYNNRLYRQCVPDVNGVPWCATNVDESLFPIESDFCLPDTDNYMNKLLRIQQDYSGLSTQENLKSLVDEIKELNEDYFINYIRGLGWQRFLLLLKGHRVFDNPPHKGTILKYIDNDVHLLDVSNKIHLPKEDELREKGLEEMLGLFGRRTFKDKSNEQIKLDHYRNQVKNELVSYLKRRKITLPNLMRESYVIGMRNFDFGTVFEEDLKYGFHANISNIEENYINAHDSYLDYLLPISQTGEICQPFLYRAKWRGYGGCVGMNGDEHQRFVCAVRTNEKGEGLAFSPCINPRERDGFWFPDLPNPIDHPKKHIITTVEGNRCVFPFKYEGNWHHSCIPKISKSDYLKKIGISPEISPEKSENLSIINENSPQKLATKSDNSVKIYKYLASIGHKLSWCPTAVNPDWSGAGFEPCDLFKEKIRNRTSLQEILLNMPIGFDSPSSAPEEDKGNGEVESKENETHRTESGGTSCAFPFVYKGTEYFQCISEDASAKWCATEVDHTGMPLYGSYCTDEIHEKNTIENSGGCRDKVTLEKSIMQPEIVFTIDGYLCQFPFEYDGKIYRECTHDFYQPRCKINNNHKQYGECRLIKTDLFDNSKQKETKSLHFPFF